MTFKAHFQPTGACCHDQFPFKYGWPCKCLIALHRCCDLRQIYFKVKLRVFISWYMTFQAHFHNTIPSFHRPDSFRKWYIRLFYICEHCKLLLWCHNQCNVVTVTWCLLSNQRGGLGQPPPTPHLSNLAFFSLENSGFAPDVTLYNDHWIIVYSSTYSSNGIMGYVDCHRHGYIWWWSDRQPELIINWL